MSASKITIEFNTREGSKREQLLLALSKKAGKQVPLADLVKETYGSRATLSQIPAMGMVAKGLGVMISKGRLPYELKKDKAGLGLYPKKRVLKTGAKRASGSAANATAA